MKISTDQEEEGEEERQQQPDVFVDDVCRNDKIKNNNVIDFNMASEKQKKQQVGPKKNLFYPA